MSHVAAEGAGPVPQAVRPVVMKFGGTSVENAAALRRVVQLVKLRQRARPIVVVSAFAGVTDELLAAGRAAAHGDLDKALQAVSALESRHALVLEELLPPDQRRCCEDHLAPDFQTCRELLSQALSSNSLNPRLQDHLLGLGECFSSKIAEALLNHAGLAAVWVDARSCVVTDAAHTQATPLWEETDNQVRVALLPLLAEEKVPVLAGFVGSTRDGFPTTLGRGGSDFSASILGAALHASRIEIWTDVDGILSADPKLCPDARRVPSMSFEEAADLAYYGAKVLHPSTIAPAMRKNIPVCVLNSRNPESRGTEIVARPENSSGNVKALTVKKGIAVVDVDAVRWLAPELLREVFAVFERHQHSLDLMSASRGSLSLLVSSTSSLPAVADELRGLANVRWENHKALVCLVGEGLRRQSDVASHVFRALSGVDLRMICQGASERNISFLVDESKADDSVRRLHQLFFTGSLGAASSSENVAYPMCQAGGSWQ